MCITSQEKRSSSVFFINFKESVVTKVVTVIDFVLADMSVRSP